MPKDTLCTCIQIENKTSIFQMIEEPEDLAEDLCEASLRGAVTLSRGERTGDDDDGGDGGYVVHGAGSDGVDNGDGDDDDDGNGDDVIDGAGIMLTMMVQLHLAKGSKRVN